MSDLVGNPEDRVSLDAAYLIPVSCGLGQKQCAVLSKSSKSTNEPTNPRSFLGAVDISLAL